MKKIVIDLDGTLTIDSPVPYSEKPPNHQVILKLKEYRKKGFLICIFTARNMSSYKGNVGEINVKTLPIIIDWLNRHNVPYDEVVVGKPWCGKEGFYVDDRAIRPDEFHSLSHDEINALLNN